MVENGGNCKTKDRLKGMKKSRRQRIVEKEPLKGLYCICVFFLRFFFFFCLFYPLCLVSIFCVLFFSVLFSRCLPKPAVGRFNDPESQSSYVLRIDVYPTPQPVTNHARGMNCFGVSLSPLCFFFVVFFSFFFFWVNKKTNDKNFP